jgi:uncharacterized protein (DUF433 family)
VFTSIGFVRDFRFGFPALGSIQNFSFRPNSNIQPPASNFKVRGVRLVAFAVHIRWYTFEIGTLGWIMSDWQPTPYRNYQWIVADPQLLGGKLAIRGTRLSVALILECLAAGMSLEDIGQAFDRAFPHEAMPEVLKVAAELTSSIQGE